MELNDCQNCQHCQKIQIEVSGVMRLRHLGFQLPAFHKFWHLRIARFAEIAKESKLNCSRAGIGFSMGF
jgi:hypothetical protein